MYLNRKQNILKRKIFNFIIVPIIISTYTIINFFSKDFNQSDKVIMSWLTIGLFAFLLQYIITFKVKAKHKSMHYLFILISINISLFIGFILEKYIINSDIWWKIWFVDPIIIFVSLFLIKEIIWWIISFKYAKKNNDDKHKQSLVEKNIELETKIKELESELEEHEKFR